MQKIVAAKKWITYKLPSSLTCHVQNLSSSLTAQALGSLYVLLMLSYIIPRGLHLISKQGFGHWSHLHVKSVYVSCLVSCQFSCLKINLWNDVTKLWLHWCFSFWIEFESIFPFLFFYGPYSSCSEVTKRLFVFFSDPHYVIYYQRRVLYAPLFLIANQYIWSIYRISVPFLFKCQWSKEMQYVLTKIWYWEEEKIPYCWLIV